MPARKQEMIEKNIRKKQHPIKIHNNQQMTEQKQKITSHTTQDDSNDIKKDRRYSTLYI